MKRRPVRLLPAVADNRELFPESLYHPSTSESQSSPHRVQQLLGEQSALMEKAHIHVVGPRSYLRSPPRRLHFIESGFHGSPQPSDQPPPSDVASSQLQQQHSAPERHHTHKKHSPLPPLQSVPAPSLAPTVIAASTDAAAGMTVEEMSSFLERFLTAHPNVSREELVKTAAMPVGVGANSERQLRSPNVDLVIPTTTSRSATPRSGDTTSNVIRSMSSARILTTGSADEFSSQARAELTGYCAPYVPKLVLCNIVSPVDDDGDGGGGEAAASGLLSHGGLAYRPWQGPAALLFIDISGYSKATTALAPFGPHALSEAVNGYLDKIIGTVVNVFGGDILKFAGDAILAAWVPPSYLRAQSQSVTEGSPGTGNAKQQRSAQNHNRQLAKEAEEDAFLQHCCASAVACAHVLQRDYAVHPIPYVEDTTMHFTLHIGVVCGTIETAVFCFPTAKNTEAAFHSISGAPLQEVGTVVDAAASREICISNRVHSLLSRSNASECCVQAVPVLLANAAETEQRKSAAAGGDSMDPTHDEQAEVTCYKLDGINVDNTLKFVAAAVTASDAAAQQQQADARGNVGIEGNGDDDAAQEQSVWALWERVVGDFVHPALKRRFASSASNVAAEMRFLAVLFISKSDPETDLNEWFGEVQAVLDARRCAIVKLIDDDKGVHVIAAAGLFASERNASLTAVEAAQQLSVREAGCNIGIAAGLTFCGVIGSTELSCRWDITGASCVRSCRLMQHAMARSPPGSCFVDASVLEHIGNRSMLDEFGERLVVKGSPDPVQAYVLTSGNTTQPAWLLTRVPSTLSLQCHQAQRTELRHFLDDCNSSSGGGTGVGGTSGVVPRCVAVVCGPTGIGKSTLAVVASQDAHYTPVLHEAIRDAPSFAIAKTLSEWFSFHPVPALRVLAKSVAAAQIDQHGSRTRRLLLQLIAAAEQEGSRTALVVKHAQLLDATSLSFLCSMLRPKYRCRVAEPQTPLLAALSSSAKSEIHNREGGSFVCVLCATPTYGCTTAASLLSTLRSRQLHESLEDHAVLVASTTHLTLAPLNEEAARDVASKTFSWDVDDSLFRVLHLYTSGVPALIQAYAQHVMAQRPYLTTMSAQGIVYLSSERRKKVSSWSWISICAAFAPQLLQLYDAVTPKHRVVLRVIACLMCQVGDRVLTEVVAHVVNKLIHQRGVEGHAQVKDMLRVLAAFDLVSTGNEGTTASSDAGYKCSVVDAAAALHKQQQDGGAGSDDDLPFTATVCIASVALRDAIQQTVTPDHRSLILSIASKFLQSILEAKTVHGAYGWVCGSWLVVAAAKIALAGEDRVGLGTQKRGSTAAPASQQPSPPWAYQQLSNLGNYCSGMHDDALLGQTVQRLREAYDLDPEPPFTPLSFTTSISLDVVGIKNYAPPISLGSGVGGVVFELCWWMRSAYVLLARKMPVPEKAAAHGRVLAQRLATHMKCLAKALSVAPSQSSSRDEVHPLLSEDHSATFSLKAIAADEATLNGIMQDLLLASVKNVETAGAAAAQGCKELAAFFSRRLVPCSMAFQEAVGGIIVAAGPTVVMEESQVPTHLDPIKASSMLALIRALRVFTEHAALSSADATLNVSLFHASMMALATSDFSTGSTKFSLPWIRDMVLKDKKESTRAFRSCIYADYLYAVAAAALAGRRASSIRGTTATGQS